MGHSRQREGTVGAGYALYMENLPLHTAWGDMWKPVSSKVFGATSLKFTSKWDWIAQWDLHRSYS